MKKSFYSWRFFKRRWVFRSINHSKHKNIPPLPFVYPAVNSDFQYFILKLTPLRRFEVEVVSLNQLVLAVALLLFVASLSVFASAAEVVKPKLNSKPNIIFIMADDLGYGDLACFGQTKIKTPNLDSIAQNGLKLTSFYGRHLCAPARACLMTGTFNLRVGIGGNVKGDDNTGLALKAMILPQVLKPAGYVSGCIGKWHLGTSAGYLPMDRGFDSYFGAPGANHGSHQTYDLPRSSQMIFKEGMTEKDYLAYSSKFGGSDRDKSHRPEGPLLMRDREAIEWPADISQLTSRYTEEAISFIKKNQDKPFFLYLAHNLVHLPWVASKAFEGHSAYGLYGDMVEELDASTGRIVQTLRELGLEQNTLVIFTSDNGADDKPKEKEKGSELPFRGWKGSDEEGGSRVPFVAQWPAVIPRGTSSNEMASLMDMLPTFASMAGVAVQVPQKVDGRSLLPMFKDPAHTATPHQYLFFAKNAGLSGIRNSKFKLLKSREQKGGVELYDLEHDVGETKEVSKQYQEVVKELSEAFEAYKEDVTTHSFSDKEKKSRK